MGTILRRLSLLFLICLRGRGGRFGLVLFGVALALRLAGIAVSIRLIAWFGDFYNALQRIDAEATVAQIGVFVVITTISASLFLIGDYIEKSLVMRWRRTLTEAMLDRWLAPGMIWTLRHARAGQPDNPDQRIAEDCNYFVENLVQLSLVGIYSFVAVVSYGVLLWNLSTFALEFSLFGLDISIPRYMVWAAPIYVAASATVTWLLGAPLVKVKAAQQHCEGDFRFGLARLREHGEEVSLWRGEAAERALLDGRFGAVVANWRRLINRELIIGCFTRPFMQTVLRVPLFLSLPGYLGGAITLGGLMQIANAFSSVVTTLSWIIFRFRDIAELAAAITRLWGFWESVAAAAASRPLIRQAGQKAGEIRFGGLRLATPGGAELLSLPDLRIEAGAPVWLRGASGLGKTTLLRAMAGLWTHGEGEVAMPAGRVVFVPQRAYLPLATLAEAAAYPFAPSAQLPPLLARFGLGHLPPDGPPGSLSGGEAQRLMLLRLLLLRPDWAILDESTSALDEATERDILALLRQELPDTTFVMISHHMPRGMGELRQIDLDPFRAAPQAQAA